MTIIITLMFIGMLGRYAVSARVLQGENKK
jgi:hypothetical protein